MKQNQGKFAIVTGASAGIGYELAKCCVDDGFDLLIVSDEPRIYEVAKELETSGSKVNAVEADLSTIEGVDALYDALNGRDVDALFANAGHGLGGAFLDQDFEEARHVLDTNVTGTIYLAHRVGNDMSARGEGRILFTGSIAGYTPGTFNAVYNGTKAFIDSFSFALRNELKDTGVTVTCLMPGATETEFFERANMEDTKIGRSKKDDPADVARVGYDAMMKGEGDVVSGWKNKLLSAAALITPSDVLAERHRKEAEPGSGKKVDGAAATTGTGQSLISKHPIITGGLLLAGAGLAYVSLKAIRSNSNAKVARDVHIETSITINKPASELYRFWRDFENLPLFMKHLESVTDQGDGKSHWIARGAAGMKIEWDAEIFNEVENE